MEKTPGPIEDLPSDLIKYLGTYLDNQALGRFSVCKKSFFNHTEQERQKRLFLIAREGGLDEVERALNANSPASNSKLLVNTLTMSWEDKEGNVTHHSDTLLRLAWRMRNQRLFLLIKGYLDKIDNKQWEAQIKAFEGNRADCLDELQEAYTAALSGRANANVAIGGAHWRCWETMSWVMHEMRNKESGWHDQDVEQSFKPDVKDVRDFLNSEYGNPNKGRLGREWYVARGRGSHGVAGMTGLGMRVFEVFFDLGHEQEVIALLISKCARDEHDILSQLSIDQSQESSIQEGPRNESTSDPDDSGVPCCR